ncbi:MAG TPA: hypothetical protein VFQ40_07445 [Actinomycetota bacterium]|nr:hypothetical protein [Actinomycetota bacterium]
MSGLPLETDDAAHAAQTILRYRGDLASFSGECLAIRTKAATQVLLRFNAAQTIVHGILEKQYLENGYIRALILKARQEGISTYVAARYQRRVTLWTDQYAVVIADQRKRGENLFGIYELFDRKLPRWLAPAKKGRRTGLRIHYDTPTGDGLNSKLQVETAKDAAAGRSFTIQAVHASELAFWENPEIAWNSLMQAVPDHGSEVIVESTANGVGNLFHRLWKDAVAGDNDYVAIFLPWWIHEEYREELSDEERLEVRATLSAAEKKMMDPGYELDGRHHPLSLEQIAWRRKTIRNKTGGDEALFRQEYPATAREAFLVAGNCFFDTDALTEYEEAAIKPQRFKIAWRGNTVLRQPRTKGRLRMWQEPYPGGEYVIGADTAEGKMSDLRESIYASEREAGGRDFSCGYVYEIHSAMYVACFHGRVPPEIFAERLFALGYMYGHRNPRTGDNRPALIGVERNHKSGETVARWLKDNSYPNLFYDRVVNQRREKRTLGVGWFTTEAKRTIMLDTFAAEILNQTVWIADEALIEECFTFIRGEDGRSAATEGCHDDRVMAAALALQMARHHPVRDVSSARTQTVRRGGPVGQLVKEEVG